MSKVAIYCGPAWQQFSPEDIELRGLGGAETAAVRLAEHLARDFGYAVTIYGDVVEACRNGVQFQDWRSFDAAERREAVIASRTPEAGGWGLNARVRLLWAHDVDFATRLTRKQSEHFDYVLCLSAWHKHYLAGAYPFCARKLRQIRNGIQLEYFEGPELERAPRVLSSSAPDRGLDILLELWPQIRAKVPGAEFAYAYWEVYDRIAAERPELRSQLERVRRLAAQDGVTALDSLSQPELAKLMRQSLVWAHPSFATTYGGPFHETSCIGAIEAQAAGCVVVASDWGALSETVQVGRLVGGEPGSDSWRASLVSEITDALTNQETQAWAQREGPKAVEGLGWNAVALQVANLIDSGGSASSTRPRGDAEASAGPPTICLNMIVRDEANVVLETLDSVAAHIDCLVAVDTGSRDATVETIRSWMAENGVRGEIHQRPWRDFGHNRSEALELARGWADYIWVIDADDLLDGELDLTALCADSYLLRYDEGIRYWRKQIFRDGLSWRYEGVVHEYPVSDDEATEERLTGDYCIASRRLGARNRSPEKYEQDAALLRDTIERDRDDARAVFYLAQSCFDSGDYAQARRWYARRAEMGEFAEEVFYSLMRCAACLVLEGEPWEHALAAYLAAHQARPVRAEPLYEIARHYRLADDFELGYLFGSAAAAVAEPDDLLFLDTDVYAWRACDELAICAYYTGRYKECFELCTELLRGNALPDSERPRIEANRDMCTPMLQAERRTVGIAPVPLATRLRTLELSELRIDVDPDWPCTGASIAATGGGFTAVVCTSPPDSADTSMRLNYLVDFDDHFTLRSVEPLVFAPSFSGSSRSVDELRLSVGHGDLWASALERPLDWTVSECSRQLGAR